MSWLHEKLLVLVWGIGDEVDRLHVKRNRIVGMNYLGIIDTFCSISFGKKANNCRRSQMIFEARLVAIFGDLELKSCLF